MRSVRLVALGRVLLGVTILLAMLLGKSGAPSATAQLEAGVGLYLLYALALLAVSRARGLSHQVLYRPIVLTIIDLAAFTALIYWTSEADSPFFSPFVFLVLSGALQWGARGAIVMGGAVLAAFLPTVVDPDTGARLVFIVRFGYMAVISMLLAAFAEHVERVTEQLARLSRTVAEPADVDESPAQAALQHAMEVFDAPAGLLVWSEGEEPHHNLALYEFGAGSTRRLALQGDASLVAPELAERVFLFDRGNGIVLADRGRVRIRNASPLSETLLSQVSFRMALVVPITAHDLKGWLLVLDHRRAASEDILLGGLFAAQVSVSFERWLSHRALRQAAASEERIRLARDLHDGVLQFLAGTSLQLDAISRTELPEEAQRRISGLKFALHDEQAELRAFVAAMRPHRWGRELPLRSLAREMKALSERLGRQWNVKVGSSMPAEIMISHRANYDLGRIVQEAVANAVRHGGASVVQLRGRLEAKDFAIEIIDNGSGFGPDEGVRGDGNAVTALRPHSLYERARALGGQLSVTSTPSGATIRVQLPLGVLTA